MDKFAAEQINSILGWQPEEVDQGIVGDLNRFPWKLIEAARQLPNLLRYPFISHYVSADNLESVGIFIQDVVENAENLADWRRGRILVPDVSPRTLVQQDVQEIIAPLSAEIGETWYQLKPRRDYWDAREFLTGSPAILRTDVNYRYMPPPGVRDLLVQGIELNHVSKLEIAIRRWIASNVARSATTRGLLDVQEPNELLHACYPDAKRFSHDAAIAVQALIKELKSLPKSSSEVPGFRGPDIWYTDENG